MPFDFVKARTNMVDGQIRPNRVNNPRLLDALETVRRELFIPPEQQELAYSEQELFFPNGRCLMAPMLLARMIDALDLQPNQRVLDVAPATGYSSVLLSYLVNAVVGLEADSGYATNAKQMVAAQARDNVEIVHGPISMGAKQLAPYDAILINGAMAEVPKTLFHQLLEGGRLVCVLGGQAGIQPGQVTLFVKHHGTVSARVLFEAAASYIPGFTPQQEFSL